jgi:hypothetical protein
MYWLIFRALEGQFTDIGKVAWWLQRNSSHLLSIARWCEPHQVHSFPRAGLLYGADKCDGTVEAVSGLQSIGGLALSTGVKTNHISNWMAELRTRP